jgi:hypothetical protein
MRKFETSGSMPGSINEMESGSAPGHPPISQTIDVDQRYRTFWGMLLLTRFPV